MPITYDDTLPDAISIVRFNIGDTVDSEGPRPDNKNFSDNEINALLTANGDDTSTVIMNLFDVLATEWSKYAISFTMGDRKEELYRISQRFEAKSREWAVTAGITQKSFAGGLVRRNDNPRTAA